MTRVVHHQSHSADYARFSRVDGPGGCDGAPKFAAMLAPQSPPNVSPLSTKGSTGIHLVSRGRLRGKVWLRRYPRQSIDERDHSR